MTTLCGGAQFTNATRIIIAAVNTLCTTTHAFVREQESGCSWSHTRTVVRECFKGDEASQWKRPKFDPRHTKTP